MFNDFQPTAAWEHLRCRADMLRRLREFFDARGFLEVETPILSADTVVDRHLDPFCVGASGQWSVASGQVGERGEGRGESCSGDAANGFQSSIFNLQSSIPRLWLQTSPEFAMKRMLAAGAGPIYQVARVFRQDELGPLHNPEFTLIEWYQPNEGYSDGMQLTAELCETLLNPPIAPLHEHKKPRPVVADRVVADRVVADRDAAADRRFLPTERISYREAFERHVGVDPHAADGLALQAVAKILGVESPASLSIDDRDGWLDLLLVERIQPHLGVGRPTILYDYPASQAALARVRVEKGTPPVAERFELYLDGVEIANGYHELLDPAELRARNAAVNRQRLADGKTSLPEESRLLAAMDAGLPPSVGVALGFDRLLMAAFGVKNIAEVIAFPFDRA